MKVTPRQWTIELNEDERDVLLKTLDKIGYLNSCATTEILDNGELDTLEDMMISLR